MEFSPAKYLAASLGSMLRLKDSSRPLQPSRSILAVTMIGLALSLAGLAHEAIPSAARAACKRFCLSVSPRRGDTKTVFRFKGRGWLPHKRVEAVYGNYCPADSACPAVAYIRPFRTDGRGAFVFRFRHGPDPILKGPKPRASGQNVRFEQWIGKPERRRLVRRAVSYYVGGELVRPLVLGFPGQRRWVAGVLASKSRADGAKYPQTSDRLLP